MSLSNSAVLLEQAAALALLIKVVLKLVGAGPSKMKEDMLTEIARIKIAAGPPSPAGPS